jgi:hypothetical protein
VNEVEFLKEKRTLRKKEESKTMVRIWRQGDVIVREVSEIPKNAVRSETDEIRVASETGNSHVLRGGKVFVSSEQQRYILLEAPASMVHPQHAALQLSQGLYHITTVRDYAPSLRLMD